MFTLRFKTNISCGHCESAVRPFLEEVPELIDWSVDLEHPDSILTVRTNEQVPGKIMGAMREAGYSAEQVVDV